MPNAIELNEVGKRYWKLVDKGMLLRSLVPFRRPKRTELWVLRDANLTVPQGETVGILGANGAGKTTLLRLLAGVSRPTEGRVRVVGRVAPLLSVGVGFHEEMSGRENIFVNGLLLGLSTREVRERFDQIVDFAELSDFIDSPVKFYSSGMFMRLGFSVAVHVDPDVMLVDEILAVGDAAFQARCFERLRELQRKGASIVFVSHSTAAIRQLCERALLIQAGRIAFDGPAEQAIARYHAVLSTEELGGGDLVEILERRLTGQQGDSHHAKHDELMELVVRVRFRQRVEDPHVGFGVYTLAGLLVVADVTARGDKWRVFEAGEEAGLRIAFRARLGGGTYEVGVRINDRNGLQLARSDGLMLFVDPRPGVRGIADLCTQFFIDGRERARDDAPAL